MKRKFYKLLGVGLALVLVVSFSLVPAAVMGQTSTYAGYQFGAGGAVTWDDTNEDTGNYAVKLDENAGALTYVEFIPAPGTTMSDLNASVIKEWSFRYHMVSGTSGGPNMELRFTSPTFVDGSGAGSATFGHADVNTQVPGGFTAGEWATEDAVTNPQVQTYFNDPVDGTGAFFDSSPFYLLSETLAAIDDDDVMTEHGSSAADWELTRVRIELADSTNRVCYIDDVTIDGATYTMEPMALDAEYYSIDETVDVTVCNGDDTANTDPMAIDTVDITVVSTTDTVGDTVTLTETGSDTGVFTGAITLLGAAPADRDADEIVVSAEDTVTVTYTGGDWGGSGGTQTITLTADVDDTAPVITIVSPVESANITSTTPLIRADYTEDGSGIDTTTAVMTFDGSAVSPATSTTTEITYTPSALDDGSYTVTVDVSDLAGNAATQLSWSFTVDTEVPVITLQVATPPVILPDDETEVTFSATVTDATSGIDSVEIDLSTVGGTADLAMLDDGVAPDATADDGIYTASENITESTEDNYTLPVNATDNAGNSAVTVNIMLGVWLDIVDPVITDPAITYPFVGVDSARPGDTVTISANVTDDIGMGTVTAACDAFTDTVTMNDAATLPDVTAGDDIYTGEGTIKDPQAQDDYTVTITAADAKGNDAVDTSLTLAVRSAATGVEIVLVEGWNLISLPLIPDDADIAAVISIDTLASGNVSSVGIVRGYDPATGEFPYYMPESASGDLTEMSDGAGYWVFMDAADNLTVTGKQWPTPPAVPPSYDVVVDWNLIGFKSIVDMVDTDYLANIAGTYPVLWSYDAVSGAYENVKGVTDGMEVGHGFWIWITEAGTIVPPG